MPDSRPLVGGERFGLDQEVDAAPRRTAARPRARSPQRIAERGLECAASSAESLQRVVGRDDHREQVGAFAVAVDEDLTHQRCAREDGLQLGDGDELALRQLEHVVASVDIDQPVRSDLGDHVAGAVVAVGVEHLGGDLGALVVARASSSGS